jgi:xanthine dehydrogenase accessory factor
MRDVLPQIEAWRAAGEAIALATVVETWGSAPRGVGAKMAVTATGKIAGSVSGGCVEGAVVEASAEVIKSGRARLLGFGVADETAWEVGLACGGRLEVFVAPLDAALFGPLRSALEGERAAATATVVGGPESSLGRSVLLTDEGSPHGSLGEKLDGPALAAAREALTDGRCRRLSLSDADVFVDAFPPSPTLVIVGGVHIAVALTSLAKALGYRTIVVDPRRVFGNEERFRNADRLLSGWPDDALGQIGLNTQTAVAVLTHDAKLDDPALRVALPSPAFYVGALGSRKTQEKRRARLLEAGLTEEHLARLHAPIGLDLGGRSPEEIALAVMGQIVAARNGRPTR